MFIDMIRNKIENNEIASYSEAVEFGAEWAKANGIATEDLENGLADNLSELLYSIYTVDHEALGRTLADLYADHIIDDLGLTLDEGLKGRNGKLNISLSYTVAIHFTVDVLYKMERKELENIFKASDKTAEVAYEMEQENEN